jgi:hypothetical protein
MRVKMENKALWSMLQGLFDKELSLINMKVRYAIAMLTIAGPLEGYKNTTEKAEEQ